MATMKDAHVFLLLRGVRVKHLGPPTLVVRTLRPSAPAVEKPLFSSVNADGGAAPPANCSLLRLIKWDLRALRVQTTAIHR